MSIRLIAWALLLGVCGPAAAGKNCEELKAEIAANLEKNKVARYSLEIVPAEAVQPEDKVVGSCEGGTRRITYKRG